MNRREITFIHNNNVSFKFTKINTIDLTLY
uniref:Uncharacterized protein n=1 Tax=Anguilla anguilla TaxID=7936 RepID=A0A0E9VYT9_ANGAN